MDRRHTSNSQRPMVSHVPGIAAVLCPFEPSNELKIRDISIADPTRITSSSENSCAVAARNMLMRFPVLYKTRRHVWEGIAPLLSGLASSHVARCMSMRSLYDGVILRPSGVLENCTKTQTTSSARRNCLATHGVNALQAAPVFLRVSFWSNFRHEYHRMG